MQVVSLSWRHFMGELARLINSKVRRADSTKETRLSTLHTRADLTVSSPMAALCDSRITRLRGGAAIRCSVRLGRLMAVRFGAGPALQKRTQRIRLLAQFRTSNVPNGKNWRKLLIQLR